MAKKNAKSSKDKDKKKSAAVKKPAKAAPKKAAAKPAAKKAVAAKKPVAKKAAAAKPAAAKAGKKAAAPKKPELKKAAAKVVEAKKKPAAPPVKPGKPEKVAKGKEKAKVAEVEELPELEALEEEGEEEIVLTDAEGRRYCRVKECDQLSSVDGYCRYHYLLFWKKIQIRKKILTEGKLERYIEELTARYPDKFLEILRKDLRSEKEFLGAIQELEIDESAVDNEFEDEAQTYIDEVRGVEPVARDDEDF